MVLRDGTRLDARDGFIDDKKRDQEPFARTDEVAEPVRHFDVELRAIKDAMDHVFKLDPIDVVKLVGSDDFDVRKEKSGIDLRTRNASFDLAACDANLVQNLAVRSHHRIIRLAAQNVDSP